MKRLTPIALTALLVLALGVPLRAAAGERAQSAQTVRPPSNCAPLTGSVNGYDPRGIAPGSPNPLTGLNFYIDPEEPSVADYNRYLSTGNTADAALIDRLASRPKFKWTGRFTKPGAVRKYLGRVQCVQPGSVPQLVTLRHQGKECNARYQAGGTAEDEATKAWYRDFASQVGDARVVIAFEPDSVGTINCLARSRRRARRDVLRYGVNVLSQLPNATIYLEATASDWKSAKYTAAILRYIGVSKVRGFMLNVTHYDWTNNNIAYGRRVSNLVGGKPFVVSTTYNGRGPVHYLERRGGRTRRINVFCNPQFRGLGPTPTANTGEAGVDAFLWINRPGVSGAGIGGCNGAPVRAGTWWPARALMFARYATEWRAPPAGTRYGFREQISLCRLGAPIRGRYSPVAPELRCGRSSQTLAGPTLGRRVNVYPVSGQVFISARGAARARASVPGLKGRRFIPLRQARQVPVGSLLDTRRGTVRIESARNTRGTIQSGEFLSGVFQVLQSRRRSARGLTELRLKGASFRRCRRARRSDARALATRSRTIRRVRGRTNGRFRTRGRYSTATVRGTDWTVGDRCDGTLTVVRRGTVTVRDLRRRKTVVLSAGKRYLARAPGQ